MARSVANQSAELPRPSLLVPRAEADAKISARLDIGSELLSRQINNPPELDQARADRKKWHDYNKELLGVIFDNEKYANEYERNSHSSMVVWGGQSFFEDVKDYRESVQVKVDALDSIKGKLELIPEPVSKSSPAEVNKHKPIATVSSTAVFVVHGHDETLKEQVARVVAILGLHPIVLHEQENQGRTIIEKLEHNAGKSSFAVVLLTPDDVGYANGDEPEKAESRARQNVVFELGYFMGKLGRNRICTLYKAGVRLPTDTDGVVYVQVNEGDDGWKLLLGKELRAAGYPADLNNL